MKYKDAMPAKLRKKYWTNTSHEQCSVRKINGKKSLISIPIWHIIMACKTVFFQNLQHLPVIYSILSIQVFSLQRIQLEWAKCSQTVCHVQQWVNFLIINHYGFIILGLQGNKLVGLPRASVEHTIARKITSSVNVILLKGITFGGKFVLRISWT